MLFLAFSAFAFILTFSVVFFIMPVMFGSLFTSLEPLIADLPPEWQKNYYNHKETLLFMTPLMLLLGTFIFIIKVLMNASARGSE